MNRLVLATAVGLVLGLALPAHGQESAFEKTAEVEGVSEYTLANKCRVVLIPDKSSNSITVNMTILVGSRHEGYGETGMAHLLEHMLFKGTPLHGDIDKELKERGVLDMNGTTDYDRTNYYETLPASDENLEWTIAMEADRLVNCFIRAEDLLSEMTVVRNEFEQGENSPIAILDQRIMATAYEWHNYGKSVIGNRADIERVPIHRLRAFYEKYYRPDNVVVFVAGNFEPEKALNALVKQFGSLPNPKSKLEPTYTAEPTQDGERIVYLNRVGDVALVGAAYHIPAVAHPDYAALAVLEKIMGDEPSGRLYGDLVKTKLASVVYSSIQPGFDPGMFSCLAQVEKDVDIDTFRKALIASIEKVTTDGVTAEEITRAVTSLNNENENAQNNTADLAYRLSNWMAFGDWRLFYVNRDRIEKVTAEDVQRVAGLYFKPSNRTIGIFSPTPDPNRSPIPNTPDIAKLVTDYKGRTAVAEVDNFDPTPDNIAAHTTRGTLKSGVKFVLLPKTVRGDRFFLSLTLRFGEEKTLNSPKMLEACSLLGDAWLTGTQNYSESELKDKIEQYKAEISASSEAGVVTFTVSGRKKFFAETLDLLEEILRRPSFPEEEFELLKTESISQIESRKSDPVMQGQTELSRRLSPYPPSHIHYVPTIEESLERIKNATVADARELYNGFLSGKVGELTVVGAFDKDVALKKLNAALDGWSSSERFVRIANPFVVAKPESISIETPDKENAVYIAGANLEVRSDDPDWEALFIANDILGGGSLASRLGERVREQEGLSYGVGSRFNADAMDRSATFMTFAITNPANRDKLVKTIGSVFDDAMASGVSQEELEAAKTSYLEQLQEILSDDEKLKSTLHQYQECDRDESFLKRRQANVSRLTKADVDAAMKKLLSKKELVIVTAGDFARAKKEDK